MKQLVLLLTFVVVLGACADGDANGDGSGSSPDADLAFVVEHPDRDTIEYTLSCRSSTATMVPEVAGLDGGTACRALDDPDVVTRLVDGPPADQVCTEEYGGPDVATITGLLDGRTVDTTVDRTNGCGISDWDDLLAALLPAPLGVTD